MRERESMRMKNLFSSPPKDLQNFSLSLEITKKMIRELREDNADIKRRLTRILTIMTDSTPVEREEEYPEEELGATKDIPGSD